MTLLLLHNFFTLVIFEISALNGFEYICAILGHQEMSFFGTIHSLYTIQMPLLQWNRVHGENGLGLEKNAFLEKCCLEDILINITHKPFPLCLSPNVLSREAKNSGY